MTPEETIEILFGLRDRYEKHHQLKMSDGALAAAAKMAKIKGYSIKAYPESRTFIDEFLEGYKKEVKVNAIQQEIGIEQWEILQQMKSIKQMMGAPQTRLPIFEVNHR